MTADGLWLVVRLPGWDRIDLFGDQDAAFELVVSVTWEAMTNPVGLTVSEVATAGRDQYGWDQYTTAFRL